MQKMLYAGGQACHLSPKMVIGQGGEAVIYKLPSGEVLKAYMEPDDPAYADNPEAQAGARFRIEEHQHKLPAFPRGLPPHVVAPLQLAYNRQTGGRVAGYTMPFLEDMEVLLSYADRKYRESRAVDANQIVTIFRDLHALVSGVHRGGVVIGDFNDLNVLVNARGETFLVDADSMQFGPFLCRTFTTRFVDPLRCKPDELKLNSPHSVESDWYAFVTMLFQALLYINPFFGGVHKPKSGTSLRNDARVLHRISVFSPDVIYPKVAVPLKALPDDLLDHFQKIYDKDQRGEFPLDLLTGLRWTTCTSCGLMHARNICPACAAAGLVKQTVTIRGTVKATKLLRTTGRILCVAFSGGTLRWLHHESGAYRREDDRVLLQGELDGELRVRIWGDKTVLGKGSTLAVIGSDGSRTRQETETVGRLPIFDANNRHLYWIDNGRLVRDGRLSSADIGSVLPNQTLVWVGDKFGFGFYRAGSLTRGMVFDAERPGINDNVPLPVIPGNLIDASCVFSNKLAWFMLSVQDGGALKNFCYVIDNKARLVASAEALQGDGTWLGDGIRGRLAMSQSLYVATDAGIIRVGVTGTTLAVDREFPDTEPFVNSLTLLLPGPHGICAVSHREIVLLEIG